MKKLLAGIVLGFIATVGLGSLMVGKAPKTQPVQPAPIVSAVAPLVQPVKQQPTFVAEVDGLNSTGTEIVAFADHIAQLPTKEERLQVVVKSVGCEFSSNGLNIDERKYLNFLTLILAAHNPEQASGNARYFLAKNMVRNNPTMARNTLDAYTATICAPTSNPSVAPVAEPVAMSEQWVKIGTTNENEELSLDVDSIQNKPHAASNFKWFRYRVGDRTINNAYTGACNSDDGALFWYANDKQIGATSQTGIDLIKRVCK
jgi:hypothetical protein